MFTKKQTSILIILILVLIGAIFLFWQKYDKWPWQKEVSVASPTVTISPESSGAPQTATLRGKIMKDLAGKIRQLSPVEPVLGGQWFVTRFWFVKGSNEYVYAEYEDGHILRMVLIKAAASGDNFEYRIEAYFEPGESDWLLRTGQDSQASQDLDLYEPDQNSGEWVKKN